MKRIGFAILAVAIGTVTASAADMAVKAPPPPPPIFNWTGFYIGGNVGGVFEHASGTSDFLDPTGALIGDSASNPQGNSPNSSNVIGGGQIGYNWQIDPRWVVGIEGDFDGTNSRYSFCRQTSLSSVACTDNGDGFESISSTTNWLATVRGRVGITVGNNNVLLYATGGAAWGNINTGLTQNCLVSGCGSSSTPLFASNSATTTKTGWVAGLGGEMALPGTWMALPGNWSVRLEWLHYDLGDVNASLSSAGTTFVAGPPGVASVQTTTWSRSEQYDVVRVGLNYRFSH